jgi:predicted RNase H-like nuclease (RuvC/YqgF family)
MNLVKSWISQAKTKEQLADLLVNNCYEDGKPISDGGKGCLCPLHLAFRGKEAERILRETKATFMAQNQALYETGERVKDLTKDRDLKAQQLGQLKDELARVSDVLSEKSTFAARAGKEASQAKQEAANLGVRVAEQEDTIIQLRGQVAKPVTALDFLK